MNIEELKGRIESRSISDDMLVFVYKTSRFLINHYIKEIADTTKKTVVYLDDIPNYGMFDVVDNEILYVIFVDEFDGGFNMKNHIIATKKTSYKDSIVFPELEHWQIVDYARGICSGADESVVDNVVSSNKDLFCLDNELHKISIFDEKIRDTLSKEFLSDGAFINIDSVDPFDFINSVQASDLKRVSSMYSGYEKDPMSFIGLMCNQFRNMVNVCLQKNPTEENTGLKSKQIYAIKKASEKYSRERIYKIFKFLISLDEKLKLGNLPMECLFDYVLVKVLSI